jgi:hypothetical protein
MPEKPIRCTPLRQLDARLTAEVSGYPDLAVELP